MRHDPADPADPVSGGGPPRLKVLVADDNRVSSRVAQMLLQRLGHTVDTVDDGVQAVEATLRGLYDAVLMDVQMPFLDGLQATRQIRTRLPAVLQPLVIAVTAGGHPDQRGECLRAGMDGCMEKPLRPGDVEAALAGVHPSRPGQQCWSGRADDDAGDRAAGISARLAELAGPDPADDAVLLPRLLVSFTERADGALDELLSALARKDVGELGRLAHELRGAAANLGATALAGACEDVEDRSRQVGAVFARSLPQRLRDEVELTVQAMRQVLAALGATAGTPAA